MRGRKTLENIGVVLSRTSSRFARALWIGTQLLRAAACVKCAMCSASAASCSIFGESRRRCSASLEATHSQILEHHCTLSPARSGQGPSTSQQCLLSQLSIVCASRSSRLRCPLSARTTRQRAQRARWHRSLHHHQCATYSTTLLASIVCTFPGTIQ